MWSNYHTHTHYCDGKGAVLDYLEACRRNGVTHIGFSSHAPLPFPCNWCMKRDAFTQYLYEIESAQNAHPGLEVYRGLEVDYIPGVISVADFAPKLDYTIGSVHFVGSYENKYWEIDNTREVFKEGLSKVFDNDIRAAVSTYYALTRRMVRQHPPDIIGHLDKIKINALGIYFMEDEGWYIDEVDKTLKAIAESNVIVEVNTRGLYKKKSDTTYPSPWILERMRNMNLSITLSSDAHHPDDLTREFPSTYRLLADIGFENISVLTRGTWTPVPLTDYGSR